jgi:hypothetical protein
MSLRRTPEDGAERVTPRLKTARSARAWPNQHTRPISAWPGPSTSAWRSTRPGRACGGSPWRRGTSTSAPAGPGRVGDPTGAGAGNGAGDRQPPLPRADGGSRHPSRSAAGDRRSAGRPFPRRARRVLPEVLNEPQASLDPVWNAYPAELLAVGGRTSSAASLPPASSSLRSWLRRGTGRSSWASSVPPTTPTWHHGPVGHAPTGSSPNVTGSPGATGRSVPASRSTTSTPTAGTGATRRTQHLKGLGVT